jgi:hypothetical protein
VYRPPHPSQKAPVGFTAAGSPVSRTRRYPGGMPVIVVGADTPLGRLTIDRLDGTVGELRAFVSDAREAETLRERGVKVAVGDVSDGSHVGGAATNAFCAVLLADAAVDDRERSFANDPPAVVAAWMDALAEAGVRRVIWPEHTAVPGGPRPIGSVAIGLVATADRPPAEVVDDIGALEAAEGWPPAPEPA